MAPNKIPSVVISEHNHYFVNSFIGSKPGGSPTFFFDASLSKTKLSMSKKGWESDMENDVESCMFRFGQILVITPKFTLT